MIEYRILSSKSVAIQGNNDLGGMDMISHDDAVKMCAILKKRRQDKARQHEYDATSFVIESISRTNRRCNMKRGSNRKLITY